MKVRITQSFADGAARSTSVKVTMGCGSGAKAWKLYKAPAVRTLTVGQDAVFDFALSSPGSDTLTHKEQPLIRAWLANWNGHPRPFVWTKTADEILDEVAAHCHRISDSGH
ncbi:hypothetical protein GCM10010302_17260 [Streptomyces polychromogenes]|uniref:Transposase n=1 Tax=Streptomyces polychromogenes TaxID=67342 RepID=A0ABP3EW46_9ACTN